MPPGILLPLMTAHATGHSLLYLEIIVGIQLALIVWLISLVLFSVWKDHHDTTDTRARWNNSKEKKV